MAPAVGLPLPSELRHRHDAGKIGVARCQPTRSMPRTPARNRARDRHRRNSGDWRQWGREPCAPPGGDRGAQVPAPVRWRAHQCGTSAPASSGSQRLRLPRHAAAVLRSRRDGADAVEQREVTVVLVQHRNKIGERDQGGEPGTPLIAMDGAIEQGVAQEVGGRHPRRGRTQHRLADHQVDVVGEAIVQAPPPMRRFRARRGLASHPHLAVDDAHGTNGHVVGPQIEGRAAAQIEPGVMPMTGEDAVLDAAAMERKAHVRAAVVEGDDVLAVGHDQHRPPGVRSPCGHGRAIRRAGLREQSPRQRRAWDRSSRAAESVRRPGRHCKSLIGTGYVIRTSEGDLCALSPQPDSAAH